MCDFYNTCVIFTKHVNVFLKTRDYEKYREWEVQGVSIEGLIFCNLDEMKTHGQKLKNKTVQNKGANGEEGVIKPSKLGGNTHQVPISLQWISLQFQEMVEI